MSAKDNTNISNMFQYVATEIKKKILSCEVPEPDRRKRIRLLLLTGALLLLVGFGLAVLED